jgi:hypothetical protein
VSLVPNTNRVKQNVFVVFVSSLLFLVLQFRRCSCPRNALPHWPIRIADGRKEAIRFGIPLTTDVKS